MDGAVETHDSAMSMCLIGKLWTNRPYNTYGLMETMKKLWNPTKGMICRDMGANLISFQFHSRRDMERVFDMEPWQFNKHILVLRKISNDIQPSLMKFSKTPFWIRLYDIPMMARDDHILRQIGGRFGQIVEIDSNTTNGIARSVRIKVLIDVEKPMKRGTRLRIGKADPCWIPITYERLPSFCYWCGMLGHTYKDCEGAQEREEREGKIIEEDLPFGEWMKASPMKSAQVVTERGNEVGRVSRRTLFSHNPIPTAVTHQERREETDSPIASNAVNNQINELLQSLQKCEVGRMRKEIEQPSINLDPNTDEDGSLKEYKLAPTLPNHHDTMQQPVEKSSQQNMDPTSYLHSYQPYTPTDILKKLDQNPKLPTYNPANQSL